MGDRALCPRCPPRSRHFAKNCPRIIAPHKARAVVKKKLRQTERRLRLRYDALKFAIEAGVLVDNAEDEHELAELTAAFCKSKAALEKRIAARRDAVDRSELDAIEAALRKAQAAVAEFSAFPHEQT